jgi:hypothetical protein
MNPTSNTQISTTTNTQINRSNTQINRSPKAPNGKTADQIKNALSNRVKPKSDKIVIDFAAPNALKENLHTVGEKRELMKVVKKEIGNLIKDAIPMLKSEMATLAKRYPLASKKILLATLQRELESKEPAIRAVLGAQMINLNFDNDISVNALIKLTKMVNEEKISKSRANKFTATEARNAIKAVETKEKREADQRRIDVALAQALTKSA